MGKSGVWLRKKAERLSQSLFNTNSGLRYKERERLFEENGRILLETVIASSKDGLRCNTIRNFSAEQVLGATHHFNHVFLRDGYGVWYKGSFDGRPLLFSKYISGDSCWLPFRDIVVSSQMSNHNNVLKLLGCCLEFPKPVLVYESAANGPLSNFVGSDDCDGGSSLSWKARLKIAIGVASAVTYLHTAFPRPVIHRDIKPGSIFLDENYAPKLGGFACTISIPEGELQAEDDLMGTVGYCDPYYCQTSCVSEHTDVYSFGVLLLVLLTGEKAVDSIRPGEGQHICKYVAGLLQNRQYDDIVDARFFEDEGRSFFEEHQLQVLAYLELAMSCISSEPINRPLMIDVAKKLIEIAKSSGLSRTVNFSSV